MIIILHRNILQKTPCYGTLMVFLKFPNPSSLKFYFSLQMLDLFSVCRVMVMANG